MENIKYVAINIWKLINNFIYTILKLFKTRNKVTFISRQTDNDSLDFNLIIEEIKKQDTTIEIVVLNKMIGKSIKEKVLYFCHMYKQMYHIATSKAVILDGYCIAISNLKHKKDLKVIQIWHALGSLKKFAYSILDKGEGSDRKMAEHMNMHKNYTYILASSENSKIHFQEAFNAKEEQMKVIPLPRVDFLSSEYYKEKTIEKFYEIYPEIDKNKKKILYVPTFRKNVKDTVFDNMIDAIDYDKYDLIIKTHDDTELIYVSKDKFYSKETKFTGMELLHVADYVITDYSAIVYETAVANKPIYFYNYDYETYIKNRGFYIDYINEMPGLITKNIEEIIKEIEEDKFDYKRLEDFKDRYVSCKNLNCTKKLVGIIIDILNNREINIENYDEKNSKYANVRSK